MCGGYGRLRNNHRLTSDNLIRAEVVTADGRLLLTSEGEHSSADALTRRR